MVQSTRRATGVAIVPITQSTVGQQVMNHSAAQEQQIPLPRTAPPKLPRRSTPLWSRLFPACVQAPASTHRRCPSGRFIQSPAVLGALRVVDASVMPNVLRGITKAPTFMIGDRLAPLVGVQNP